MKRATLLLLLLLQSCATPMPPIVKPVEVAPPKLPPAPASVMVAREANFLQRLQSFFGILPSKPTP